MKTKGKRVSGERAFREKSEGRAVRRAGGGQSGRKKQKKGGNIAAFSVVLVSALEAVRRILLTNIVGDEGNAYFGAAYELYSVILLASTCGLPFAVTKMVAARSKKGQLGNCLRVFKGAFAFALTAGGGLGLLMFFGADLLAGPLMLEPLAAYAVRVLSPALLLAAVAGVYRGYFEGIGTLMPTAVSRALEQAGLLAASLITAKLVFGYGTQVGLLLQNENFGPAYAAAGSMLGYSAGAVLAILFLLFVFAAFRKMMRSQAAKDTTKTKEPYGQIIRILLTTSAPAAFGVAAYHLCNLVNQRIYNQLLAVPGSGSAKWGVFYGKYRVFIDIGLIFAGMVCASRVPAITANAGRGEHKRTRDLTGFAVRSQTVISIPLSAAMAVLAEPLTQLLFPGKTALASQMLRFGSFCILFSALSMLAGEILRGIGRTAAPAVHALIAFGVQTFAVFAMLEWLELDIMSIVYANLIFSALSCLLNMFALQRAVHYRQEWIRTLLIPIAVSGAVSIPVYFIHKGVESLLGNGAGVAAALMAGFLLYGLLLLLLRVVNEREAEALPCGRLFVSLARLLHIL